MSNEGFSSLFAKSAATAVLAVGLGVSAPEEALAQASVEHTDTPPDLNTARGLDSIAVVTWGDSIGNGVGLNLRNVFKNAVNLGRDGAGLTNAITPLPINDIPKGAAVIMSMGTNDVEGLMHAPQQRIDAYADRVIRIAQSVRAAGGVPIVLGMQAPLEPYTGSVPGGLSRWNAPGFLENWTATMHRVNAAIEKAAKAQRIAFSPVQDRVPERAKDFLHYTVRGSRHIAANALKDAGIRY